ncbi:MAG: DDE-type integrase/transposase/recombinase [Candidatus Thioglobus sp.]|uniref:DDE-type integrase/transposase/recombinase n=1 Tax=Candidatus Thioglobus sp. TaxID=2026721 RepID=UPI002634C22D|nr:DDE-type integrase/transposase/recombinase [Candidatus Thioglobus sp.]MDC9727393.1 DDE-type integrase/transposase/recombinase [Candidatus Thioglobus sp.]
MALDAIEKRLNDFKRYILTFVDLYTRFAFAYATDKHTALEAGRFLTNIKALFPFEMQHILTDNGSEFKKEFDEQVDNHWHTYPRTPKMNAHCERFNRTLQDELIDYHLYDLENTDEFNEKMSDYLFWHPKGICSLRSWAYNAKSAHYSLGQIAPIEYIKMNEKKYRKKCNMLWTHTLSCIYLLKRL